MPKSTTSRCIECGRTFSHHPAQRRRYCSPDCFERRFLRAGAEQRIAHTISEESPHSIGANMNILTCFPSKYVRAADLNGKPITVTIARIVVEKVGQDQEEKPVVYFQRAQKGLILNKVNAMTIASLYGIETDGWVNRQVTLYVTKVRAFGATHDAIRIKEQIPAQAAPQKNGAAAQAVEEAALADAEDLLDHDDANPFDN
jgi:hypothetical protein